MTISDLIARLTKIMKEKGPTLQVKLGRAIKSKENPFDAFYVIPPDTGEGSVFLIPHDDWEKSDLKRLAEREAMR